jgi:hypothetical protein
MSAHCAIIIVFPTSLNWLIHYIKIFHTGFADHNEIFISNYIQFLSARSNLEKKKKVNLDAV